MATVFLSKVLTNALRPPVFYWHTDEADKTMTTDQILFFLDYQ
ncbi:hypothetical protein [Bacteroides nordii]